MKTRFLLLLLLPLFAFAQTDIGIFTVVAPSGLSMRAEADLSSERLTVIPYGTKIELPNYTGSHQVDLFEIGDRLGYWAYVKYGKLNGYVFSAYLFEGEPFVQATAINKNYRIMAGGYRCDAINYDPTLNWYAWVPVQEDNARMQLQKINPLLEMAGDSPYESSDYPFCTALQVTRAEGDTENYPRLFFGSREALDLTAINPGLTYPEPLGDYYQPQGLVPYPYQAVEIVHSGDTPYYLRGHEDHFFHEELQEWQRDHLVLLTNSRPDYYDEKPLGQNLSELLQIEDFYSDSDASYGRLYYEHPRLIWQSDLNGDGFPDLLFQRPNIMESCGGSEEYYLLFSEKQTNDTFLYRKVAEESVFSCS